MDTFAPSATSSIRASSSIRSSSGSPATPATACSSTGTQFTRAAALDGQRHRRRSPTSRPRSAPPPARRSACRASSSTSPSHDINTPGDAPDVLVAMNPAALKTNLNDLKHGGIADRQHRRVHRGQPQEGRLRRRTRSRTAPSTATGCSRSTSRKLTLRGARAVGLGTKEALRAKNFLALGLVFWMYGREPESDRRVAAPEVRQEARLRRGERQGVQGRLPLRRDRRGVPDRSTRSRRPSSTPGMYRNITGNEATRVGPGRRRRARRHRSCSSARYPITPASSILHSLAKYKNFGVTTFQAEDEIAAIGAALGAAYGGSLGVTASSGPGIALKGEAMGLARHDRAAARHHQHPARRPVDRPADQDRAERPAAGAVRPQRRVRRCRCSRPHARATASTGDRGRADRDAST